VDSFSWVFSVFSCTAKKKKRRAFLITTSVPISGSSREDPLPHFFRQGKRHYYICIIHLFIKPCSARRSGQKQTRIKRTTARAHQVRPFLLRSADMLRYRNFRRKSLAEYRLQCNFIRDESALVLCGHCSVLAKQLAVIL